MRARGFAGAFVLALSALRPAGAQQQPITNPADTSKTTTPAKPYTIPPSPAFTFLGTNPGSIDRPTTARALAVSLAEDFRAGEIPRGLAVDVAPWFLVPGLRITPLRYRTDPVAYVMANTQVSLGSLQAKTDTGSTDLALGIRTTVFDRGDPMTDTAYTNEVRRGLLKCIASVPSNGPTADTTALHKCAADATVQIRSRWLESHWNAPSLAVAGALGWRFAESKADASDWLGWAGWVTAGVPLFKGGQVLGQLRYDQRGADGSGLSYGGRAYLGSASAHAFAEVSHLAVGSEDHPTSWAGGVEFRAFQSFWLSTGFGTVTRPEAGAQTVAVIANLRWDVSMAPRFGRIFQ